MFCMRKMGEGLIKWASFHKNVQDFKQHDNMRTLDFFDIAYRTKLFLCEHVIDMRIEPAPV